MTKHTVLLVSLALFVCISACRTPPPAPNAAPHPGGITVRAHWKGAGPRATAEKLAEPLHQELREIDGVTQTVAECDTDGCTITVQHEGGVPGYKVAFEVQTLIQRMQDKLPRGAQVVAYATNTQRPPDLVVALLLDRSVRTTDAYFAASEFAAGLMRLPTLERYELPGKPTETVRVEIDPARLKAMNEKLKTKITTADVADAIRKEILVLDEYTRIVVGRRPGSKGDVGSIVLGTVPPPGRGTVQVRHVARVRRETTTPVTYRVNGEPAVLVRLYLRSDVGTEEREAALGRVLEQKRPEGVRRAVPVSIRME